MKCELCEKEATYRLSPDLDIHGLGAYELHKEVVKQAYLLLMTIG